LAKSTHFDVLVIGTVCVDLVFGAMPHWPEPGEQMGVGRFNAGCGGIFNTAAALSRLGLHVGLLTMVNDDFLGRFILSEIANAGISQELVLKTSEIPLRAISVCLAHKEERGIVWYEDLEDAPMIHMLAALSEDETRQKSEAERSLRAELEQMLQKYTFESVFLSAQAHFSPFLDLLRDHKCSIFMDPGGEIANLQNPRLVDSMIGRSHVIMPNLREAQYMTGQEEAEAAALQLAQWGPAVIVKVGAKGAIGCQGQDLYHCPSHPIAEAVDTTGAGDAFNAGFIYGWIRGYSFLEMMRCGTICGSLSTTALTGTSAVPTKDELEELLLRSEYAPIDLK
jgi:sugar/nucleoside kinase (ribokinase family)